MKIKPSKGYAIVSPRGHILPVSVSKTKKNCIEVFITVMKEGRPYRTYYTDPHTVGWERAAAYGWQCIKVDISPSPEFIRDRLK